LTEQSNLRDVVLFPLMKSKNNVKQKKDEINIFSSKNKEKKEDISLPTIVDCEKLASKYLSSTLNHCKQV
jgi:hypothetical protein